MIITHVDLAVPTDEYIVGKLASFKNAGGVNIPRDNVILFNNTSKSLEPLIAKIKPGNMRFHHDIVAKGMEIFRELPGDFKKQDKTEGTNN